MKAIQFKPPFYISGTTVLDKEHKEVKQFRTIEQAIDACTLWNQDVKFNVVDTVVEEVREDLHNRSQVGIKKYNTTLDRNDVDLKGWLQHAYEEALDMALYLKRASKSVYTEEDLKKAYEDGGEHERQRCGEFDINNYKKH